MCKNICVPKYTCVCGVCVFVYVCVCLWLRISLKLVLCVFLNHSTFYLLREGL